MDSHEALEKETIDFMGVNQLVLLNSQTAYIGITLRM